MSDFTRGVAIIPARGGSKGLPRKNVRVLAGKPLLAHTVEQALATPAISRVIVSTDDGEIADVAVRFGAEVVRRPAEISGDAASSESAVLHVLDSLSKRERYEPDLIVFLQATSPLRTADDIAAAIRTFDEEGADSLLSVCDLHGFVWHKAPGALTPVTYDFRQRPRRQDALRYVVENGSIYVFKPWVIREHGNRLGGLITSYEMSPRTLFQIDTADDFEILEALMSSARPALDPHHFSDVRLLVLDFDGVMTDNRAIVFDDGHEAVVCHRGDGWGIGQLRQAGLDVVVLSAEVNPVVEARCRKLRIPFVQGCSEKLEQLKEFARERGLRASQIAYVGNDANDLACLGWVGVPIAVADAEPDVRSAARLVTTRLGGSGAVREVADAWLKAAGTRSGGEARESVNRGVEQ